MGLVTKTKENFGTQRKQNNWTEKNDIVFDSITMGSATGHCAHSNTCVKNVMGPIAKSNAQVILKTMPQNNQVATNEEQTKQSKKIAKC